MAELPKVHRLFLQAIANHGSIDKKSALEILIGIQDAYGEGEVVIDDKKLREIIGEINEVVASYEQNIKFVRMDWSDTLEEFVVLCSSLNSTEMKLSVQYNQAESNYLKTLFEAIATANDYCISIIDALNLSTHLPNTQTTSKRITKNRAQELVKDWTLNGYLRADADHEHFTFGARAIGEFGQILLQCYADDLQRCTVCNEIALKPIFCPNQHNGCVGALDRYCANKYLQKSKKCPQCKTAWQYPE